MIGNCWNIFSWATSAWATGSWKNFDGVVLSVSASGYGFKKDMLLGLYDKLIMEEDDMILQTLLVSLPIILEHEL